MTSNSKYIHNRGVYSMEQAAEWLGVHINTLSSLVKGQKIGFTKAGKRILISSNDLDTYMDKNHQSPSFQIESIVKGSIKNQSAK